MGVGAGVEFYVYGAKWLNFTANNAPGASYNLYKKIFTQKWCKNTCVIINILNCYSIQKHKIMWTTISQDLETTTPAYLHLALNYFVCFAYMFSLLE